MEVVKIHRLRRANKYKKEMDRSFEVIYHNLKRIQEDKVSLKTRTSSYCQTQESSKEESVTDLGHVGNELQAQPTEASINLKTRNRKVTFYDEVSPN